MSGTHDASHGALVTLDFDAQVQLAGVLAAVGEYRDLLEGGFYESEADTIAALAERLERSTETQVSLSSRELAALGVVVETAWRFTNRRASAMPLTPLNNVAGMRDADFFALVRWLDAVRGEHFPQGIAPTPGLVELDDTRCGQLLEIVAYVKEIHRHIDPDMYDVETRHFDAITALLTRAARHHRVEMTHDERDLMETVVDAAWTYSYRATGNGLARVKDAEFKGLVDWLGAA